MSKFSQMLRASYKSMDTEELFDIYFNRPIGLMLALVCKWLHITPNAITISSFFIGGAAGFFFYHNTNEPNGLLLNIIGVVLMMLANFCDSADGQLARLTNQKSLIGRMLDGFGGDIWFASCYVGISLRLTGDTLSVFGHDINWAWAIWPMCSLAGLYCHARQCALADYYRNIHLFFLLGKEGSELDNYKSQRKIYEEARKNKDIVGILFFFNYANYCHGQESRTPQFQRLYALVQERFGSHIPQEFRDEFRQLSLPLMKYTNILTHNTRATVLFVSCLINLPWIYPLFEIVVLHSLLTYMHYRHESFCKKLYEKYSA